ncbi:hypothetical protein F8388_009364 [Cannabis sativa]|uniref:Maf-like protein n=1 Tax=Cannabis sativa TaxID=3483 RepID=A0A7J6GKD6_CANSA|nr:hypothetical protein F8388_009364 [Cannabis sativa]KAF4393272.1 hypothetical protein G4B88_002006 [Cannabis sativa]
MSFQIILGSASMARRRLLTEMGYEFTILTADIDERSIRKETPEELVVALAEAKVDAIISRLKSTGQLEEVSQERLLITADTMCFLLHRLIDFEVVVSYGQIREKPSSKEEARSFIKGYSGSQAAVVGSVLVTNLKTGKRRGGWERAEVYFHDIPEDIIDSLVEEAVTLNVAGGLTLENPLILRFVDAVVGTSDAVMGLPKALTEKLIHEAL